MFFYIQKNDSEISILINPKSNNIMYHRLKEIFNIKMLFELEVESLPLKFYLNELLYTLN
jgi:hypothetical protein